MRLGPAGAADLTYSGADLKEKLSRLEVFLKALPGVPWGVLFSGVATW
jgi:hypothetical protein